LGVDAISIDGGVLRQAASRVAKHSDGVEASRSRFAGDAVPAANAFGNTSGSDAAHGAYSEVMQAALHATDSIRRMLDRHADALRSTSDAFDRAEDDAARSAGA
jgi:uncharacterized protein YukE